MAGIDISEERLRFEVAYPASFLIYFDSVGNCYRPSAAHHEGFAREQSIRWETWQRRASLQVVPAGAAS